MLGVAWTVVDVRSVDLVVVSGSIVLSRVDGVLLSKVLIVEAALPLVRHRVVRDGEHVDFIAVLLDTVVVGRFGRELVAQVGADFWVVGSVWVLKAVSTGDDDERVDTSVAIDVFLSNVDGAVVRAFDIVAGNGRAWVIWLGEVISVTAAKAFGESRRDELGDAVDKTAKGVAWEFGDLKVQVETQGATQLIDASSKSDAEVEVEWGGNCARGDGRDGCDGNRGANHGDIIRADEEGVGEARERYRGEMM